MFNNLPLIAALAILAGPILVSLVVGLMSWRNYRTGKARAAARKLAEDAFFGERTDADIWTHAAQNRRGPR